ncbi:MAG: hypothetical protein NTZ35_17340 [Ignavibacteriales bacterium]|nr:hypothetical protein [Ignavibacteriales bacterium]
MIPLSRIYSKGASLLRSRLYISIVLLAFLTDGAVAQREVIYMAVLSSFRPRDKGDSTPAAGLFVSTDQGHTWQHRGWHDYIRDFYSEEGSDGTIWSACGNGVLRSTDAGKTWRITTDWKVTEVLKVKAAEMDPAVVFASTAYGIIRSTNKGVSWEKKVLGMRRAYSGDVCIDRTDPQHVLAATEDGAYVSEDCGERWVAADLTAKGVRVVVQDPHDAKRFWIGTEEDGVFCSQDGGRRWEQRSTGLDHRTVYTITVHPQKKNWLYAGTFGGGVYLSTDGGAHWERRSRGLTDLQVHAIVVLPSDPRIVLAGTLNKGLFRSIDGGETWQFNSHDDAQVWGLSVRSIKAGK